MIGCVMAQIMAAKETLNLVGVKYISLLLSFNIEGGGGELKHMLSTYLNCPQHQQNVVNNVVF